MSRSPRRLLFLPLLLALTLLLAACSPRSASPAALQEIRLPMGYIPNVQYAPFYVAVAKGYYRDAGLQINFDYSSETDGITLLGAGELSFTVASAEQVLLARARGLPVVYVMNWWQDFPVAIAAPVEQGIRTPQDLAGKKIGLPGLFGASYIGLIALLDSAGLTEADVTLDAIGFNQVEALLAGQEDAIVVYANNEPIQLRAQGLQVDVLRVADYVSLASNGLVSSQSVIETDPDLVQRMVAATRQGIEYTLANPDEAFEICKDFVEGLEENRAIQRQVFDASLAYWQPPAGDPVGLSQLESWQNMQHVLLQMGLLEDALPVDQAFTNAFIQP